MSLKETNGSMEQVQQTSLTDLHSFFSAQLEGMNFSISTGILEQVSRPPYIFRTVPWALFLPKGRNTILHSWTCFFIGGAFTCWHSSFGGGSLFCLSSFFHSLMYILDVCRNGGVLITPSINASIFISLLGEGFSHEVFPLSPLYGRLHFIMYMGTLHGLAAETHSKFSS